MLDSSIPAALLQAKAPHISATSSSGSSSAAERAAVKERQLQERYGANSSAAVELELLLQCAQQCLGDEQQQHCGDDGSDTCYECHLALAEVSITLICFSCEVYTLDRLCAVYQLWKLLYTRAAQLWQPNGDVLGIAHKSLQ
jgi:hypothetical protein